MATSCRCATLASATSVESARQRYCSIALRRVILCVVLCLVMLHMMQDMVKALEYYNKAAENKSARALHLLGAAYEEGRGVEKNNQKALDLYTQAAELGHTHSMQLLGSVYQLGLLGQAKDDVKV